MPKLHFCTHLQNRHNLWSFKQKKNVFEGHFLCDLYHFIVWFHVKKIPQDFCKLQMCKCFFAKTQNIKHLIKLKCLLYYQYAHSCSNHDFFLNFSTHLHFTVTAKSLYMKSCHEPDPQWELWLVCDIMKMLFVCKHALGSGL